MLCQHICWFQLHARRILRGICLIPQMALCNQAVLSLPARLHDSCRLRLGLRSSDKSQAQTAMEDEEWFSLDMQSRLCYNVYAAGWENFERETAISQIRENWICPSADAAWQAVLDEQQGLRMLQTAWSAGGCRCPNRNRVRPVRLRRGLWHTCRPLDLVAARQARHIITKAKKRYMYHYGRVQHLG